jgi:hypothetical protein
MKDITERFICTTKITKPYNQHGEIIAMAIWDTSYTFRFNRYDEVINFASDIFASPYSIVIYHNADTYYISETRDLIKVKDTMKHIDKIHSRIALKYENSNITIEYRGIDFMHLSKITDSYRIYVTDYLLFEALIGKQLDYESDIYEGNLPAFIFHLKRYADSK